MDVNELALRRTQMGRAVGALAIRQDMEHRVESGSWLLLTGAPSPDVNMVLVHEGVEATLADALNRIEDRDCPALVMLAGDGLELAAQFPDGWDAVGVMPMMTVDLATTPTTPDDRVRLAGPDDVEVLTALLAESYGMPHDIAAIMSEGTAGGGTDMKAWLLEENGQAVSTVATCLVDDGVSVWAMGTPERFGRRGYARALLAAVLDRARNDGAKLGLLGATPAGQPLYEATGWRTVEDWQIFTNATSAQFSH